MASEQAAGEEVALKAEIPELTGFEAIENIQISLHAELDRKTLSFGQLMNLRVGSVLECGRPTGEDIDLYAGNVFLGSGELLIVDSTLAVRIADLRSDEGSAPEGELG